ncbi:acyltransferase [Pseudomonas putida]|uniref:acyltransferase family protein n=1 Tax=Pseudomonas putida TaxID=303 RepID=UPI0023637171|nr:acyltransferase [Pseudomonas putida]MDD2055960.1 acyltransferase [Pseudomonas putida]
MLVQNLLRRNASNLDVIRVVAACMVIYGHAYSIAPEAGYSDFIQNLLGFDYTGSLAVKIFFFISGLVVTNSLLVKKDIVSFAISRFFRIWPAFMFVVLVSALIIGPLYSTLGVVDYFKSSQFNVIDYIWSNFVLDIRYYLPGVFFDLPYEAAVNGSLWTLYYEVAAYLALLLFFVLGIFRDRFVGTLALLLVITSLHFLQPDGLHPVMHQPLLMQCFAFGALIALYKDLFDLHFGVLALSWLAYIVTKDLALSKYFLYVSIFITLLYVSGLRLMLLLKTRVDISYGVYLWGFPVQQILAHHFLDLGVHFNQMAGILICLLLGFLSWHLIEFRFIRYGSNLAKLINESLSRVSNSQSGRV